MVVKSSHPERGCLWNTDSGGFIQKYPQHPEGPLAGQSLSAVLPTLRVTGTLGGPTETRPSFLLRVGHRHTPQLQRQDGASRTLIGLGCPKASAHEGLSHPHRRGRNGGRGPSACYELIDGFIDRLQPAACVPARSSESKAPTGSLSFRKGQNLNSDLNWPGHSPAISNHHNDDVTNVIL